MPPQIQKILTDWQERMDEQLMWQKVQAIGLVALGAAAVAGVFLKR